MKFELNLILLMGWMTSLGEVNSFMASKALNVIVGEINNGLGTDLGRVSESYTHGDIIRMGLIKSIANYLQDQPMPSRRGLSLFSTRDDDSKIRKKKFNNFTLYYQNVRYLYRDAYGEWFDKLEVDYLIDKVFVVNVALPDYDASAKNLPDAHFDAERFAESNQRIIDLKKVIQYSLHRKDYFTARKLSAQVLHTIQDFYSHSNWVEMGRSNQINVQIGTSEFGKQLTSEGHDDTATCDDNCTLIRVECSKVTEGLVNLVNGLIEAGSIVKCPVEYYKCSNDNLLVSDQLVSGYYVNQALEDGTTVSKPVNKRKCSHGGVLDTDSYKIESLGGINKDSGYYLFSPHAHSHLAAVELAVNHTELFFDQIRDLIGDREFNYFLRIKVDKTLVDYVIQILGTIISFFY